MNPHPSSVHGPRKLATARFVAMAWLALTAGGGFSVRAQVVLTSLTPAYGLTGAEVVLTGVGLPAAGIVTLQVGGAAATILERTTSSIRFTVPASATTGPVEVTVDGTAYRFNQPFTATRLLTARIASETQVNPTNYTLGTLYSDASGTGPDYIVEVAKGDLTLVAASAGETDPVLMAIAADADNLIILDARSTALAMLQIMPGIQTLDPGEASRRLAFFFGRPGTTTLSNAIQAQLAVRQDYLGAPAFEQALIAAVNAFLNEYVPSPPAAGGGMPQRMSSEDFVNGIHGFAAGYPRDLVTPGFEGLRRLVTVSEGAGVNERGLPIIKVKVKSAPAPAPLFSFIDVNPLDWMANLYELDPKDIHLDTLTKTANRRGDFDTVYVRLNPRPLGRLHVKAKAISRLLDFPELVTDFVMSLLTPSSVTQDFLEIPADYPGVYMIRAFSGARFEPQADLIKRLPDGQREDRLMTTLNLVIAVHDAVGILVKSKAIAGEDCFGKFVSSLVLSLGVAVDRESAQGHSRARRS